VGGRIVLELAGKLVPHGTAGAASVATPAEAAWKPQVVAAMTSLGWSEKDATSSIDKALSDSPELEAGGQVAEILRATLRWLGQDGARAGNRVGSRG
jgi:Holliday junction DNA helicase RuvA